MKREGEKRESARERNLDVHENDIIAAFVGRKGADHSKGFKPIRGQIDIYRVRPQHLLNHAHGNLLIRRMVIHQQDPPPIRAHPLACLVPPRQHV